jgi:hypothetical protein
LSLGQIHSALAYYWDHREALDKQFEAEAAGIERMREENSAHQEPFVAELKARWAKMHKACDSQELRRRWRSQR